MTDDQEDQDVTRWTVHGRRTMYESEWVNVYVDDVELPDGRHIDHHVLDMRRSSVGAVVVDDQGSTLLIWRHRYITDTWGWEVPAGWVDPGEDPEAAVRREVEEETGWRAGHVEPMVEYRPLAGISNQHYRTYVVKHPRFVRDVGDSTETSRVEWIELDAVPQLADDGRITDGPSLLMLSYYLGMYRCLNP
jgi:8-oxo-dGTP pyrophosphatase MutT (NUDIX family)